MKSKKLKQAALLNPRVKKLLPLTEEQKSNKLDFFEVTHDSVVATINLVAKTIHQEIRIWWGDEIQTSPNVINLRKQKLNLGGNNLPKNTFKIQHVYDHKTSKRKIILVQSIDNKGKSAWEIAAIDIEPRYNFINYPVTLELNNHFDTIFESNSEFKIKMNVSHNSNDLLEEEWEENIQTSNPGGGTIFPIYFTLEGSRINVALSYSDSPVHISFFIKEKDGGLKNIFKVLSHIPSKFDTSNVSFPIFHPRYYTGSKDFRTNYVLHDGTITIIFRTEMNLIIPLDRTPEVLAIL